MSTWWYVSDGERKGPVSDDDLHQLLISGAINSATVVWKTGMEAWQPAAQVDALAATLASLPPEIPPREKPPEPIATTRPPMSTAQPRKQMGTAQRVARVAMFIGLMYVIGTIVAHVVPERPSPEAQALAKAEQDKDAGLDLRDMMSLSDLKAAMKNPKSFELSLAFRRNDGTSCLEYHATNGFGGTVPGYAVITGDKVLTSASAWNAHCANKTGKDITYRLNTMDWLLPGH